MNKSKFHDYDAFVDKFVPKKTTDDCYTHQPVYDAILDFVARTWHLAPDTPITRPFWPGADYKAYDYPDGCVVVDNPPFSILSQIIRYYCDRGIRFFLFAPALTLFTARDCDLTYILAAEQLGRKCYMMEIESHYCDIILARWEKLTGRKAEKLN